MGFTQIPITINTAIKKMINPDNLPYSPLKNSNRPEFIAENEFVLAVSFIGNDSLATALSAGDTFDGGGDINFIHTSAIGTLDEILTATNVITSLEATAVPEGDIPVAGNIRVFNESGEWERIPYTAYNSATNTFTIDDHTMIYTYAIGDVVKVEENLMFYFGDDAVDIPGDWDDISRIGGKISIRVSCFSDSFSERLINSTGGRERIYIEIRRYPAGETKSSTMLLDSAYAQATVVDQNGEPGYTSVQYLNQSSGDARYEPISPPVSVDFKIVQENTVYTVPAGKIFKPAIGDVLTTEITGAATLFSYKWIADSTDLMPEMQATNNAVGEFVSDNLNAQKYWPSGTIIKMEVTIADTSTTHTGKAIIKGVLIDE